MQSSCFLCCCCLHTPLVVLWFVLVFFAPPLTKSPHPQSFRWAHFLHFACCTAGTNACGGTPEAVNFHTFSRNLQECAHTQFPAQAPPSLPPALARSLGQSLELMQDVSPLAGKHRSLSLLRSVGLLVL